MCIIVPKPLPPEICEVRMNSQDWFNPQLSNIIAYEDTQGDQWKFTGAHKLLSVFINSLSNRVMFFSLISPRRPWAVSVFRAPVSGTMILSRLNANLSDPN